jgi:hypothetical protein
MSNKRDGNRQNGAGSDAYRVACHGQENPEVRILVL